jgi:hypothetical protein
MQQLSIDTHPGACTEKVLIVDRAAWPATTTEHVLKDCFRGIDWLSRIVVKAVDPQAPVSATVTFGGDVIMRRDGVGSVVLGLTDRAGNYHALSLKDAAFSALIVTVVTTGGIVATFTGIAAPLQPDCRTGFIPFWDASKPPRVPPIRVQGQWDATLFNQALVYHDGMVLLAHA